MAMARCSAASPGTSDGLMSKFASQAGGASIASDVLRPEAVARGGSGLSQTPAHGCFPQVDEDQSISVSACHRAHDAHEHPKLSLVERWLFRKNVWPAPSASCFDLSGTEQSGVNVSRLGASSLPRWKSAQPGP